MPIISKHLVARDNAVIGLSIVFTSTTCINSYGSDHNSEIAAHIVSSILIDESSPKRLNRAKVLDPRFCFVGVYNGPHKQYGNMTVIVYSQNVNTVATSPARAPPPLKSSASARHPIPPPPHSPLPAAPVPASSATAAAPTASSPKPEDTHTITKISETPDKTAYTMELCPLTHEELESALLVKKGSFVVLRHGGRDQMWRMPFPLTSVSSITAFCQESESEPEKTLLMLKISKALSDAPDGKLVEIVSENIVVPTNASVPPKVRPQIKLKTSTAECIEAYLGVCSSDVHVTVKLVRTEIARSNVQFEFQFQEITASGNMKTLRGNQTVRLPFVSSKDDIQITLEEDGSLDVRIQAPKPLPFNPSEEEEPISRA